MRNRRPTLVTTGMVIGVTASIAFGCNSVSGIDDLTFNGGNELDTKDEIPPDFGVPIPDSSVPDSPGQVCGEAAEIKLPIKNPRCLPCAREKCCTELTKCAADSACVAERACRQTCNNDLKCVVDCRNAHSCALPILDRLATCYLGKCAADCTDPSIAPDGGECIPPLVGTCNPASPQCGCAANQNCVYTSVGGETGCIAAGTEAIDTPCTADADCVKGAVCARGACKPTCDAEYACGAGRSLCLQIRRRSEECKADLPIFGSGYCATKCNPIQPSAACGPGLTCNAYTSYTDCTGPVGAGAGPGGCTTGAEQCAVGYTCLFTYDDSYTHVADTCEQWCRVGLADCPGSTICFENAWAPTIDGTTYGTCRTACELADPSSCGAGGSCYWFQDAQGKAYTDCYSTTGTGHGDGACNKTHTDLECRAGDTCIQGTGSQSNVYSCREWCRIGSSDCSAGETCQSFANAPKVGTTQYGVCN